MLPTKFLCSNCAPFDSPVVPPVYCNTAVSSKVKATATGAFLAPNAKVCRKLTAWGKE